MAASGSPSDPGLQTVHDVFDSLQVDARWSQWTDREFSWWGHRQRQRVWSEPGVEMQGAIVYRIFAETDVFGVTGNLGAAALHQLEQIARQGSMSGFILSGGTLRLRCAVWAYEEIRSWLSRIFQMAVLAQIVEADALAERADEVGLTAAISAHPENGPRGERDAMLDGLKALPLRTAPSRWNNQADLAELLEMFEQQRILANMHEGDLIAELPYGPNGGPAVIGGTSNLLAISSDVTHPFLGSGLSLRLSARSTAARNGRAIDWLGLNDLEEQTVCLAHFLGSWCQPSDREPAFVSFLPNVLYRPGLLMNLVFSVGVRSQWIAPFLEAGPG